MKIRVLTAEQLPMDATHQRGALTFTVSSALAFRKATDLHVVESDGQAIAYARTPRGELITLGDSAFDAVTRLATLATRPEGRE